MTDDEKMLAYLSALNEARFREKDYQVVKKHAKTAGLPRLRREPSQSESERPAFLAACAVVGVPTPVWEWQFAGDRRWAFDYAWPEVRLALEVQGGIFSYGRHTTGEGFGRDMEKWNAAVALGWFVIFCIPGEKNKVARTPKRRALSWQIPALMHLDTARLVKRVFDAHAALRFPPARPAPAPEITAHVPVTCFRCPLPAAYTIESNRRVDACRDHYSDGVTFAMEPL